MTTVLLYVVCALGIISRTILPYLVALRDAPETKFDRKFLLPPLIGILINLLVAPFVFKTIPGSADWIVAYIVGWGSTDISREALKFVGGTVPALNAVK